MVCYSIQFVMYGLSHYLPYSLHFPSGTIRFSCADCWPCEQPISDDDYNNDTGNGDNHGDCGTDNFV